MADLKTAIVTQHELLSGPEEGQGSDTAAVRERILCQQELQSTEPAPPWTMTLFRRRQQRNLDEIATQPSVFDDPEKARYFQPTEDYENIHRFDPGARWTWAEELPLINKIDWNIMLWAWIVHLTLELDRGNLAQANTDNFLDDLGLSTDDFNLGNTVFKLTIICVDLPSQLISKKVGPDRWIPTIVCLWSIVSASQFWLDGRASFLTCRVLLGLLQGGFVPTMILYLSYFFKGTELPSRLALFYTAWKAVDVVSPILAYGILRLRGYHGQEGWRWLFLIEGVFTLTVGVWSWFVMVPSPTQSRSWYRPKGLFDEREEIIMVNRILRDDPSKGDMHNRQAVDMKGLWKSLWDFDIWPIYITGFIYKLPAGPPDQYLTLILRDLGFDTLKSNLLTIPSRFVSIFTLLLLPYLSEIWNERSLMALFSQVWVLPNLIALAVLPSSISPWVKYAVVSILLSYPVPQAMQVGWCSRNSNTVRARTVSAAIYNMFICFSGIVYSNIYRSDDKPEYRRGNKQLVAICAGNIVIYLLIRFYYIWRNKQRDSEWNVMAKEEQLHYLETAPDKGNKRKDFRFAY